jgi:hypothetical protein
VVKSSTDPDKVAVATDGTMTVNEYDKVVKSPDNSLDNLVKISMEDWIALGVNRDPKTIYWIGGELENRAFLPMPDVDRADTVQLVPAAGGEWTATKSGYVSAYGFTTVATRFVSVSRNGVPIYSMSSPSVAAAGNSGARWTFPVSVGDVIRLYQSPSGDLVGAQMIYIPPKWEGFILPNIVDEPDYSLLEIDTGVKWIDGKTIYQKVVPFTQTVTSGVMADYTLIGGGVVDALVGGTGRFTTQAGNQFVIPFKAGVTDNALNILKKVSAGFTGEVVAEIEWVSNNVISGHAILKYTKL